MLEKIRSFQPYMLSILRVVVAFVFLLHGVQKFGFLDGMDRRGGTAGKVAGVPSMLWAAGYVETIGGPLVLVGLFTRPVAFILAGEMAVGYFRTHFPQGWWPLTNGGEEAVFYCFLYLYLVTAGGGPWSLDALLWKKKD